MGLTRITRNQLDFMVGAYAFVCLVYVPPPLATLLALPIATDGSIAVTASGYGLGLKESWV